MTTSNLIDISSGPKSWTELPPPISPLAFLELEDKVQSCERIIGYNFTNKYLCFEALLTYNTTVMDEGVEFIVRKNDSLAVHGDTVLDVYLSSLWLKTGRSKEEYTTLRLEVAGIKNVAAICLDCGLDECAFLTEQTPNLKSSPRARATLLKAVIGAVATDGDLNKTELGCLLFRLGFRHELLERPALQKQ
ncbi:hypothetical protein LTR41_005420 [Exophiala xenobiotica]|nr:hypothetical protein LTR41_005420 [Exophiala xenobiotica]